MSRPAPQGGPVVTVVIPAYNAERSIARALQSVVDQTLGDFEVIVVDDASSDGTAQVLRSWVHRDARIATIRHDGNRGVSAARNTGFAAARGEWIAILDADDAYLPSRLERLVAVGREHGADLVADDIRYFDWHHDAAVESAIGRDDGTVETITATALIRHSMPGSRSFDFSLLKMMFRRDFVSSHGLAYLVGLRQGEDFTMYAHALLAGARMVLLHEAHYLYTERVGRLSRKSSDLSRTVENCDEMRRQTLALIEHPAVRRDPGLVRVLRERARAIGWYESWERLYQPLRQRRLLPALRVALTDWRALVGLGREAMRRVGVPRRTAVARDGDGR